ncbi:hypothetical protein [Rhodococcus sp. H29-C3]|uniref:hypothetical protein n=1 Tax=Rhodococcus sp. H29-C3 TaxID=3046307 RepID=UPI0024B95341|nr:hypothetical protein [Rhodococcus sp. H29-C3]MDJ0361847.1 hypothetical protein [Rhodococcus sp. H29-C3]
MDFEGLDGPAGGRRPIAADGPFSLTVDGEVFVVTLSRDEPGACHYDWSSGPNEGYGFSSSAPRVAYGGVRDRADTPSFTFPPSTIDEHKESIRDFLGMINPETGYIGD